MLPNKQSRRHSLCNVMSHVLLFAYRIKLNVSTKNTVTKILQKKLHCELNLSFQRNAENTSKNRFKGTLSKENQYLLVRK